MEENSAILEVRNFLSEWLTKKEVSNNILGVNPKDLSPKEIAYRLGEYLEKNSKSIKTPRVYQFLSYTKKSSIDEVEGDLAFLLNVISPNNKRKERDEIEEIIEKDEYRVELFSSVGLTRLENQDYVKYLEVENGIVLIVADGVGGGDSGEIASKLVVESIIEFFRKEFHSKMEKEQIKEFLKDSILKANERLVNFAKNNNKSTMATTLSMTLILNGKELYIAHVGDSRVYELKDNREVIQRTPDHSVREILYQSRKITEEEKEQYKKNILAYVVGKSNLKPENIFIEYSILYSDSKLLLCSDGFWEKIDIDKNTFNIPFNALKEQIYSKIPTDNVTFIRYFPKHTKTKEAKLECEESDNSIEIEDFREEVKDSKSNPKIDNSIKKESKNFYNHFSNRKLRSRVFKNKKRAILITATLAVIAVLVVLYIFYL